MFADDDNKEWAESEATGGEARSSLKGESLTPETPDKGEGDGEAVILAGVGDLDNLGLLSRDFSPLELCCCFACCLHLARLFLNQT